MTQLAYLHDAYAREIEATVVSVSGRDVELDRTVLYAAGGGQPHDLGMIAGSQVVAVTKVGGSNAVSHTLAAEAALPEVGETVRVVVDWDRRHQLMRTHTAMHLLCGVMNVDHGVSVTGGNMEPLSGRLDFEFPQPPEGFKADLEVRLNEEIAADRPIGVSFVSREQANQDPSLIRTKVNLIPASVTEVRVVDIDGLDRQADGGTHVGSTAEVGRIRVAKIESKGKGFRRVRIEVQDR